MKEEIENKLSNLYDLQLVYSRISEINKFSYNIYLNFKNININLIHCKFHIKNLKKKIIHYENKMKENKKNIQYNKYIIKIYESNQYTRTTERKVDLMNKEIEYKNLKIDLYSKNIHELEFKIINNKKQITKTAKIYNDKINYLLKNKSNFQKIKKKYEKEKTILIQKSILLKNIIEPKLFNLYIKIRSRYKNGLAIVPVANNVAFGSYFVIPYKIGLYIYKRKKIIIDEYSGRILIDSTLAKEEIKKIFYYKNK